MLLVQNLMNSTSQGIDIGRAHFILAESTLKLKFSFHSWITFFSCSGWFFFFFLHFEISF